MNSTTCVSMTTVIYWPMSIEKYLSTIHQGLDSTACLSIITNILANLSIEGDQRALHVLFLGGQMTSCLVFV